MSAALLNALAREEARSEGYKWLARAAAGGVAPATSLLAATARPDPFLGRLGRGAALENHAEQMRHNTGWVSSCVNAISNRAAGQPLRLARLRPDAAQTSAAARVSKAYLPKQLHAFQSRLEVLPSHPILRAIERPNPIMVRFGLMKVTVAALELTGKAYWWVYRNRQARPGPGGMVSPYTILPLPPQWVQPVHSDDRLFVKWEVSPGGGQPTTVPGEEIVYFYYPDPANPLAALSPLQCIGRSVLADENIAEAQRRSFSNGIWPGLILTVARNVGAQGQPGARPKLSREQRKALIAPVLQAYRGVINYDEPMVLDGWLESVSRLSNTPRDMDFLKSSAVTKERITQGFGVNPIIMGQVENANRASSATADDHFCSTNINPKLELLGQYLTMYLPLVFGVDEADLLLYFEPGYGYDPEFELARQKAMYDRGCLDGNELRGENGLPPRPGAAAAQIMNTYVPVNLDEEPQYPPPPADPAAGGGGLDDLFGDGGGGGAGGGAPADGQGGQSGGQSGGKPAEGGAKPGEGLQAPAKYARPLDGMGAREQVAYWLKAARKGEGRLAAALAAYFGRVYREARAGVGGGGGTAREIAARCFSPRSWDADLKAAARPALEALCREGAQKELTLNRPARAGEKAARITLPPDVRAAVAEHVKAAFRRPYWKGINDATRERLEAAFQAALDAGGGAKELADAVAGVLGPAAARKRALNVARTEATGALNAGQQAARKRLARAGLVTGKRWAALKGPRTRPSHAEANGQRVGVDEPFSVGGHECQYPGDLSLPPEERCRCLLPGATVQGRVEAACRSLYRGKALEVITATGRRLALTPNHPVLTENGFITAGSLQRGEQVLAYEAKVNCVVVRGVAENVNNVPTKIEQIFQSLCLAGTLEISDAHREYFHGDGKALHGQVEVVRVDRRLSFDGIAGGSQERRHGGLTLAAATDVAESCQRAFGQPFGRIDAAAGGRPRFAQLPFDGGPVRLEPRPLQPLRVGAAADLDTGFTEGAKDRPTVAAALVRQLLERHPGEVSLDEVIEVRELDFCGHVYDLQCEDGLIVAQGIYISNCRCAALSEAAPLSPRRAWCVAEWFALGA